MQILFKKKTTMAKVNSFINGQWGSCQGDDKKITSGKRRMISKQLIKKQLEE